MSSLNPQADRLQRSDQFRLQLARYRRVFLSFWWIPALTIGLGLAFQGWQALTRPLSYESFARILVSGRIALPEEGVFSEEAVNFFGTQIELMSGQEVKRRAAARVQRLRPDLVACPVSLSVAQLPRTSIFVLQASGSQPEYLQAFLNAVLEEYIALRRGILEDKSQTALTDITGQLARVERDLRETEQDILNWKSENNLVFLKEGADAAGAQLIRLNSELAVQESEFSLMGRLSEEQNFGRAAAGAAQPVEKPAGNPTEGEPDFLLTGELAGLTQNYFAARRQLALLERERAELLRVRQAVHPRVVAVDQEIQATQRLIELLREQAREEMESRKQTLSAQIANTRDQIAKWEERAVAMGRRMGEFERMQEKLDREKGLYERLLASIQRVDVNSNIQQDILSVMEYATPPGVHLRSLTRELFLGALFGLAAGLGVLLLIAAFDDRIVSISEIQSMLSQEAVGIVPEVPQGQQLLQLTDSDNPGLLEATRKIRSWLLFSKWEKGPPKSVMIASAVPREGKSTTAYNLAVCLSSTGKSVLLVDADLRRGQLHRLLDIDQDPGLGNILNGECPVERAIVQTRFANLSAIPRGFYEVRGSEVFLGASVDHFLDEIEKKFDLVIFDTAPCLATDEASILAGRLDIVLMVIRSGFTSMRIAKRTLAHLDERGAAIEGIIYNWVNPSSHEYPYYHYYYYDDPVRPSGASKPLEGGKEIS